MTEQLLSTVNGRVMDHGRTHRSEIGYEALDLAEVVPGDEVMIFTDRGEFAFVKGDDLDHPAALEGWIYPQTREEAIGKVALVLFEQHFRTQRVVLRRGIEVGILNLLSEEPNLVEHLGVVEGIGYQSVGDIV